jgi:hypothetical protein
MNPGFNYDGNLQNCFQCNLQFIGQHVCPGVSYGPEAAGFITKPYTVQPGENMQSIANRFGVAINDLMSVNKHIQYANRVFPNDPLNIPVGRM